MIISERVPLKIGFAICGSFCTFDKIKKVIKSLIEIGCDVTPIMSFYSYNTDTKFGDAKTHIQQIEKLTNKPIIHTIETAEPIGPNKMFDIMVVAPCTGNTLAKLTLSIVDTAVVMIWKHLTLIWS